jgi:hypothetical protein
MSLSNEFTIAAKTCTLKYNDQKNGGIILDNKSKYVVPIYQRPYSWTENQVSKFVADIFSSYWGVDGNIVGEPMFIGTMQLSDKSGIVEQDVIDGQQRLSTFLILLKVLKNRFPFNTELASINLDFLKTKVNSGNQQMFLEELINSNLEVNEETLNPYLKNAYLINEVIEEEQKKTSEDGSSAFNIDSFIKYLLAKVYFVVIETKAGLSKTLQIFNAINTTGLDLNGSDVFKIKMFEYLTNKKGEKESAFEKISSLYQKIDDKNLELGYAEIDMQTILGIYQFILIAKYNLPVTLYSYATDTFFERLFDTIFNINKWEHFRSNVDSIEMSIEDIDRIIEVRYEWENSSYPTAEDACVYYLFRWYSRYGRYWNLIFVFLFRFKNEENCFERMLCFKKQLNKLYLVYSIRYQRAITEVHAFTYTLLRALLHSSYEEIMYTINQKIKSIEQNKKWFIQDVLEKDIVYNAKIKNIICRLSAMIEEDYRTTDREKIEIIRKLLFESPIDIEHIQSYHDINGEKREDIWNEWQHNINSIGNLIVLEQRINRSISNNEYSAKKNSYPESRFNIVKKHATDYPDWNLTKCIERREKETTKIINYILN